MDLALLPRLILLFGITTLIFFALRWRAENVELRSRTVRLVRKFLEATNRERELEDHVARLAEQIVVAEAPTRFTAEQIADLRKAGACIHCGGYHVRNCGRLRSIRFNIDGRTPSEVTYWKTWDMSQTVWPEDLVEAEVSGN